MEPQKAEDVYDSIKAYMDEHRGERSEWYVGIASNWSNRLVVDHNVAKEHRWWIAKQCYTNSAARKVEAALLSLGCDGGGGGGDEDTVFVYAYLKSGITNP
jgi:hypothetical protein